MPTDSASYAQDLLSRKAFATDLERFIFTEHQFVPGGLVLSLQAPFGSGKSTFSTMWLDDLRTRRKLDRHLPRPVTINAWESDFCGDPMIAILSALKIALTDPDSVDQDQKSANALKAAAKDIGNFAIGLANSFVAHTTGIDAVAAGDFAEARSRKGDPVSDDLLGVFEKRREALGTLKQTLERIFGGATVKAVVVIDELDRCRPDYAIQYLETIKHIFDIRGIAFVLCIDERQLRSAAGVLFGKDLAFEEYLRKFVHRTVHLPSPSAEELKTLAADYTTRYLVVENGRRCVLPSSHETIKGIAELLVAFQVSLRQIQEIYRILGHALATTKDSKWGPGWTFSAGIIFMGALRVADRNAYHRIGVSDLEPEQLAEFLTALSSYPASQKWWFKVLVTGLRSRDGIEASIASTMIKLGIIDSTQNATTAVPEILGQFVRGWGSFVSSDSHLKRVYDRIEGIKSFGQ